MQDHQSAPPPAVDDATATIVAELVAYARRMAALRALLPSKRAHGNAVRLRFGVVSEEYLDAMADLREVEDELDSAIASAQAFAERNSEALSEYFETLPYFAGKAAIG